MASVTDSTRHSPGVLKAAGVFLESTFKGRKAASEPSVRQLPSQEKPNQTEEDIDQRISTLLLEKLKKNTANFAQDSFVFANLFFVATVGVNYFFPASCSHFPFWSRLMDSAVTTATHRLYMGFCPSGLKKLAFPFVWLASRGAVAYLSHELPISMNFPERAVALCGGNSIPSVVMVPAATAVLYSFYSSWSSRKAQKE